MSAKFEIKKSTNDHFHFNLKAANGEIILSSQMYTTKQAAEHGIESVKTNAPHHDRFEKNASKDGQHYFVLKAANGEVIGKSEMYTSTGGMENGIQSVMKNGPAAEISDLT